MNSCANGSPMPSSRRATCKRRIDDGEPAVLLLALRRIADARGGMAKLAKETGLAREALYRTLSKNGNPRLTSLRAIVS